MKRSLSNFFQVRRRIPSSDNRSIGIKWGASHYAVVFHGEADDIEPDNLPVKDNIGECNSLFSMDIYNKVKEATENVNKRYYSETDASYNDMQTEATLSLIQNGSVAYSMLCTIYRTQTGYLAEDVDKLKLSPVLFNHSWHHTNSSDWHDDVLFAIIKQETDYQTQDQIKDSNIVDFAVSIANEPWNNLVKTITKNVYLPKKIREMCEHLFTTVFMDPDAAYNPSFVVMQPASGWVDYNPEFNDDKTLKKLTATQKYLSGYDTYDENNGFDQPNSTSTWSDIKQYFDDYAKYVSTMFKLFPQMKEVLQELEINNGNEFNFTRDLDHTTLLVIDTENITDLIQSTAFAPFVDDEMGDYNEALSDMLHASPVIVRDKARSHFSANLAYKKLDEIETEGSYELFLQGKVIPLEYTYFEYQSSDFRGNYVWTYLVPRELQDGDTVDQYKKVTLLNSILADTGAVVPIYNIVQTTMNSTTKGSYVTPRPTINCFYKTITNIAVYVEEAQTSFFKN